MGGDVERDRTGEAQERERSEEPAGPVSRTARDHARDRDDHQDDRDQGQDGGEDAHAM